jgi:hypothetical protein
MERKLLKGALYSFAISILLGLVIFPDTQTTITGAGLSQVREVPLREYFFKLARFASLLTLGTLLFIWLKHSFVLTDQKTSLRQFMKGVVVSFAVVLFLILICSFVFTSLINPR